MTSAPYVCPFRHLAYFPCRVWQLVSGQWREEWRAGLWSLAEAERVYAELGRLIPVLRALEAERQERATRADVEGLAGRPRQAA